MAKILRRNFAVVLLRRDQGSAFGVRSCTSDALVEVNPGEVGIIAGIPQEQLRRRVLIYSPARTASQQGAGKVGKWKINFLSTQKFVTSGEVRKRSEFFEPFILGMSNTTVEQFCKTSVEPMGEESDHIHITALSDELGVPIRVVYLDRSSCDKEGGASVNHHDFVPESDNATTTSTSESSSDTNPTIVLLYRSGHYDILYRK